MSLDKAIGSGKSAGGVGMSAGRRVWEELELLKRENEQLRARVERLELLAPCAAPLYQSPPTWPPKSPDKWRVTCTTKGDSDVVPDLEAMRRSIEDIEAGRVKAVDDIIERLRREQEAEDERRLDEIIFAGPSS